MFTNILLDFIAGVGQLLLIQQKNLHVVMAHNRQLLKQQGDILKELGELRDAMKSGDATSSIATSSTLFSLI